jgi:hypothetical protein
VCVQVWRVTWALIVIAAFVVPPFVLHMRDSSAMIWEIPAWRVALFSSGFVASYYVADLLVRTTLWALDHLFSCLTTAEVAAKAAGGPRAGGQAGGGGLVGRAGVAVVDWMWSAAHSLARALWVLALFVLWQELIVRAYSEEAAYFGVNKAHRRALRATDAASAAGAAAAAAGEAGAGAPPSGSSRAWTFDSYPGVPSSVELVSKLLLITLIVTAVLAVKQILIEVRRTQDRQRATSPC